MMSPIPVSRLSDDMTISNSNSLYQSSTFSNKKPTIRKVISHAIESSHYTNLGLLSTKATSNFSPETSLYTDVSALKDNEKPIELPEPKKVQVPIIPLS